jgi:hypothetical protein
LPPGFEINAAAPFVSFRESEATGSGIKPKRFTEGNEGNEEFARPVLELRQSQSQPPEGGVPSLPHSFGIKAKLPISV